MHTHHLHVFSVLPFHCLLIQFHDEVLPLHGRVPWESLFPLCLVRKTTLCRRLKKKEMKECDLPLSASRIAAFFSYSTRSFPSRFFRNRYSRLNRMWRLRLILLRIVVWPWSCVDFLLSISADPFIIYKSYLAVEKGKKNVKKIFYF